MKKYLFENLEVTWWAEYQVDSMETEDKFKILGIRSRSIDGTINSTDIDSSMIALGLPNHYGDSFTEVQFKNIAASKNLNLFMCYESKDWEDKYEALPLTAAPTNIVLAVGVTNPVSGVTNVAIPNNGETDYTGLVEGWVADTADTVKLTVTNAASTSSTITINGETYSSGSDYVIQEGISILIIVVTTNRSNYFSTVRRFVVSVIPD
jgi:hypothetical protein